MERTQLPFSVQTRLEQKVRQLQVYQDPTRLVQDVIQLFPLCPSLLPRTGALGTQEVLSNPYTIYSNMPSLRQYHTAQGGKELLVLVGTVPIEYRGGKYNIPINIWIVEGYPLAPPLCQVAPTAGNIATF